MAGSAGSPPVLTVAFAYSRVDGSLRPLGFAGKAKELREDLLIEDAFEVEYVPREQSDALAHELERFVAFYTGRPPAHAEPLITALNSYREATAGEDGDDD